MEPETRIVVKCSKTDQCNGIWYPDDRKKPKHKICSHHGVHELIRAGASQPNVACVKADHCPLHLKDANCFPVE